MATYVRVDSNQRLDSWEVSGLEATRINIPNARAHVNAYVKAASGQDIWEAVRAQLPAFFSIPGNRFAKTNLEAGYYYPRIARPSSHHGRAGKEAFYPAAASIATELTIACSQYLVLLRQLHQICETVHPCKETLGCFGHEIRNLLILACTEVESQWKAVLAANGVEKERCTTNDYVKLAPVLRLEEYSMSFPHYPWLPPAQPFKGWARSRKPSEELVWFAAYNAVKHDRERNFGEATLEHVFNAVSANAIMLAAQFGWAFRMNNLFANVIEFATYPIWDPEEVYVSIERIPEKAEWISTNYPF